MKIQQDYIIFKDFHYSHLLPRIHFNISTLEFSFKFNSNCLYHLGNTHDLDINKLYGHGFGINHHINSFRLGWNCSKVNGCIQLFAYWYNKGQRYWMYMEDVNVDREYSVIIYFDRSSNMITTTVTDCVTNAGRMNHFDFSFSGVPNWGLVLMPYFGGDLTAPHRMDIPVTYNLFP